MYLKTLVVASDGLHDLLRERLKAISQHSIDIVGISSEVKAVNDLVGLVQPDIMILDPALDNGSLLKEWPERFGSTPVLICVCESDVHAVDAFNAGAAHYVTIPLKSDQLDLAFRRAVARIVRYDREGGNGNQARESRVPFRCDVIALPSLDGIAIRQHQDLVSAHGEGNYTRVVFKDEMPMLLSRTLGDVEPSLQRAGLLRVHRSHMINPGLVRKVRRGKSPVVELTNGQEVDVSERYKEFLFAMLHIHRRR
jgi:two-component system, LytTR family, response regulator